MLFRYMKTLFSSLILLFCGELQSGRAHSARGNK